MAVLKFRNAEGGIETVGMGGGGGGSVSAEVTKIRAVISSSAYTDAGDGQYSATKTIAWASLPGFTNDNCAILGWSKGMNANQGTVLTGQVTTFPAISANASGIRIIDRATAAASTTFYIYVTKFVDTIDLGNLT